MESFKKILFVQLLIVLASPAYATTMRMTCEGFLSEHNISKEAREEQERNRAYEIRIQSEELAADVVDAIRANPHGFSHRDAEKAIIQNLGDLSGMASHYLEQSNHWAHSEELKVSLAKLNYALASFTSAAKRYEDLKNPGLKGKFLGLFNKQAMTERRLADVVDEIRTSRHMVQTTRESLNQALDSFEALKVQFGQHLAKMKDSIAVLEAATNLVQIDSMLNDQERINAHYALSKYLNSVATSITSSETSLSMLQTQYASTDMAVKHSEGQIRALVDAMASKGVMAGIFKPPYYVKEELEKNPHVRREITEIFYSDMSDTEKIKQLSTGVFYNLTIEEILVVTKLMPKGNDARTSWNAFLVALSKTQKYGTWVDADAVRSTDVEILFKILMMTGPKAETLTIDRAEFARLKDYVSDVLDHSQTLNKDGMQNKFKTAIRSYIMDLTDELLKTHFGTTDLEGPKK
jgi:hypothetical protein